MLRKRCLGHKEEYLSFFKNFPASIEFDCYARIGNGFSVNHYRAFHTANMVLNPLRNQAARLTFHEILDSL